MNNILGGSGGLGGLEAILGGGKGGGVAALLPAVLGMLGGGSGKSGKSGGANGLGQLINSLGSNGLGDIVGSWVGTGPNKAITPGQVKKGLGKKKLAELSSQSGLPADQVAQHLSSILPGLVNHLTPDGKVPDAASLNQALEGLQGPVPKA